MTRLKFLLAATILAMLVMPLLLISWGQLIFNKGIDDLVLLRALDKIVERLQP